MLLNIPIDPTQPDHQFTIELEKVVYTLRFQLNSRTNQWIMSILTEDETVLVDSIAIVANSGLIDQYGNQNLPPGEFYCLDMTGQNEEPTTESLGVTHLLIYMESGTDVTDV